MLRLHDYLPSGNGYKVRMLLARLGVEYELVEHDIKTGATREPAFLALNPNGKIPIVELGDGRVLAESHAILWYFGEGTHFIPEDRFERARVVQWMCFEQYSLEPFIGTLRYWRASLGRSPDEIGAERYAEKRAGGERALGILDAQLALRAWMVGETCTLADLALYAYTHVAEEGDFALEPWAHVRSWHARVAADPAHRPITQP